MRKLLFFAFAIISLVLGLLAGWWWWWPRPAPVAPLSPPFLSLPKPCQDVSFEGMTHIVCTFDPAVHDIRIAHADLNDRPFGSVAAFDTAMMRQRQFSLLSMNAGMYHKDLSPVGLLIEEGKRIAALNLDDGVGNFFMKPNGVFMIGKDGQAAVMEAFDYSRAMPDTLYATQSGPMLVIGGQIHPRFEPNGTSRHIRNGVGVDRNNQVVLAISRKAVSLGHFARLFRNELNCDNALFLDGAISTMTSHGKRIAGGKYPAGPILSVFEKEP